MSTRVKLTKLMLLALAMLQGEGVNASDPSKAYSIDSAKDGYHYRDCADDKAGPPLAECAKLRISSSLENAYIGEFFEEGLDATQDESFFALRSTRIPIAIPRKKYADSDSWVFLGRKYFKISKSVPTLATGRTADVIAVVAHLDRFGGADKVKGVNSFEVMQSIVLTFWYDESRGVEAIGIPRTAGDKAVYFCTQQPCLFSRGSE